MFSLKDPSLLAFQDRRNDPNLKALFGIGQIPSDTRMREILDPVDPEQLRPLFGDVFRRLQRGKALEGFAFYAGHYLLSLDGSTKNDCERNAARRLLRNIRREHPHLKLIVVVKDGLASNGPHVRDLLSNRVPSEAGIALVVAIYSAIKTHSVLPALVILGDLSIQGNIKSMRSLAEPLQVAMDNGARRALIPLE